MCIWDPDMSPFCSPLTHSIHHGKGHNMIKSSKATIPDPQHTSRGLSIYRGSVCLMSPTHMPNNHTMWYLLDTQHILLTLVFLRIAQHLAGPRQVCLGSRYVAVLSTTHPQHTLWEGHWHHKSSKCIWECDNSRSPTHISWTLNISRFIVFHVSNIRAK